MGWRDRRDGRGRNRRRWPPAPRLPAVAVCVAAIGLSGLVAGCGADEPSGTEERVAKPSGARGTLVVGTETPFGPFEEREAPDAYGGFDIELVEAIAERLDLEVDFVETPFDVIFVELADGSFDMVAAATTITPDREVRVDFSDPYYLSDLAVLVRDGSPISAVGDLRGETVGAQLGTTDADYARNETPARAVETFPEYDDAFEALAAGKLDAVIVERAVAEDAAAVIEGLEVAATISTEERFGFAFQEEADELRERVNGALESLKEDGTFAELYAKHFGEQPPDELLDATHKPG